VLEFRMWDEYIFLSVDTASLADMQTKKLRPFL
jgi:hypothetical protein